jgi:hypothetical protein
MCILMRFNAVQTNPDALQIYIPWLSFQTSMIIQSNSKSLRDFRPLRYSSRYGHAEREHTYRGRDTPKFLAYLPGARYIYPWWRDRCHNWLGFGKFQDTERFLIPCTHQVSSRRPSSGETCKYAMVPSTPNNLERFSTYWHAPFCCVCLGCCAAEFGISGRTYELPCTSA